MTAILEIKIGYNFYKQWRSQDSAKGRDFKYKLHTVFVTFVTLYFTFLLNLCIRLRSYRLPQFCVACPPF